MSSTSPAAELVSILGRAEAALARGDSEAANVDMKAGADLCRRLQAAGITVPARELGVLRELADRCGVALARIAKELNAESLRDENHRRGIVTYHEALSR